MPIEVGNNNIRARVRLPGTFEPGSFRTITLDEERGIKQVIGRLNGEQTTKAQSILFDLSKYKWDEKKVLEWLKSHGLEAI